jgi:phosphoglycerate dehydrogenase-like enzyme
MHRLIVSLALLALLSLFTAARADPPAALPAAERLVAELGLQADARPVRDYPGWRALTRIVVRGDLADARAWLAPVAQGAEIVVVNTPAEALAAVPGADALLGYCDADILAAASGLLWIQTFNAGVERCVTLPEVRKRSIIVTNMQRVLGPAMAEHGIAMLLALSRHLDTYVVRGTDGRWDRAPGPGKPVQVVAGKTLLVVGLGGIGTEVARRAHALGMQVIATRASGRPGPEFVRHVGKPDELHALAAQADAVISALPLTDDTRALFDARFFAALKPGAYFINLGRGQSVVTADLLAALGSGRLAGAGLDVTDPEPLPAEHPLWRTPRVIITPHMSASSDSDSGTRALIVRENLRRWQAGEPLLSVVDIGRGY